LPPVNALLADDWVRHAVLLERFKNGELKKLIAFLDKEVTPTIVAKADKIASRYQQMGYSKLSIARRRRALLSQLRGMDRIVQGGTSLLHARLKGTLGVLAKKEAAWAAQTLQRNIPLRVGYSLPAPDLLRSIVTTRPMQGRFLREWTKQVGVTASNNVRQAIMVGVAQGDSVGAIVRRIRGVASAGYSGSVLQKMRNDASMVTRTAINHVTTHARDAVFEQNKQVIAKVQWMSTLDTRTSQICASLDGQTWDIGKGPRPPAHLNCRSIMVPVTRPPVGIPGIDAGKLPEAQRAAMAGPVPAKMSFGRWLKGQPAKVQDTILGNAERGRLYRRGKVPIEKFVDVGTLQPISLSRLQTLERRMLAGGVSAPSVVTLAQGPYDLLQTIRTMPEGLLMRSPNGQLFFRLDVLRAHIFSVTGKSPSIQYLPRMLNKLKAEGLLEKASPTLWRLTDTGKSIEVVVGKKAAKKVAKVVTPPQPKPTGKVIEGETGEQLRIRLLREQKKTLAELDELKAEAVRLDGIRDEALAAMEQARRKHRSSIPGSNWDTWEKSKEFAEWESKILPMSKKLNAAKQAIADVLRADVSRVAMRREIAAGGNAKVKFEYETKGSPFKIKGDSGVAHKPSDILKARVEEAAEFHNNLWRRPAGYSTHRIEVWPCKESLRAFALPQGRMPSSLHLKQGEYLRRRRSTPQIFISKNESVKTIVHEMGHTIEYSGRMTRDAQMYRAYRAAKRGADGKLRLPKQTSVYDYDPLSKERGWIDELLDGYAGKRYDSGDTEIISMLTEYLYLDPGKLMVKDPRSFDFIIDLMRGVPAEQQAWFKALSQADQAFLRKIGNG